MKKLLILLALTFHVSGYAQTIEPAPSDKAVVYFVRNQHLGFAVTFKYFDFTEVIGIFSGANYFRYECEPGAHLFWASSENKDFLKAYLKAGEIYVVHVKVSFGIRQGRVNLIPVNSADYNLYEAKKLLLKKEPLEFSEDLKDYLTIEYKKKILRGMKKYNKSKDKVRSLGSYSLKPEDLTLKK